MSVIKELPEKYDADRLLKDYHSYTKFDYQILVTSIDGSSYHYTTGDLSQYKGMKQEDFSNINSFFRGSYTEYVYEDLNKKYGVCRARFLTMDKLIRAYSYHRDPTPRIHIPLQTTDLSMFYIEEKMYRLPNVGSTYWVDTTKNHSALHLSREQNRIHFVVCLMS